MKLELSFPLTQGEKEFVRFMLENTVTVEDNGGTGAQIVATPDAKTAAEKEWPPLEAVKESEALRDETPLTEPAPEPKPKAKPKTKVEPKPEPEPVEEDDADEEPAAAEASDDDGADYLKLATEKAVAMIKAKQRPKVLEALDAVGLGRVSDAEDQDTAKKLYEALIA